MEPRAAEPSGGKVVAPDEPSGGVEPTEGLAPNLTERPRRRSRRAVLRRAGRAAP